MKQLEIMKSIKELTENEYIHPTTKEDYFKLMKTLDSLGFVLCQGTRYTDFGEFNSNVCFCPKKGQYDLVVCDELAYLYEDLDRIIYSVDQIKELNN